MAGVDIACSHPELRWARAEPSPGLDPPRHTFLSPRRVPPLGALLPAETNPSVTAGRSGGLISKEMEHRKTNHLEGMGMSAVQKI